MFTFINGNEMQRKIVCLLGGAGFVGRAVAHELAEAEFSVRIPTRRREKIKKDLIVNPSIDVVDIDLNQKSSLSEILEGSDIVINLIGILHETKKYSFQKVHVDLVEQIVEACINKGIERFIHVSALGTSENSPSKYLRSKWEGEQRILSGQENIPTTIFKPSIVFGPGDQFVNLLSQMCKYLPVVPVVKPDAKFQPIHVGDLANLIVMSISMSETHGKVFEVGGPEVYTFQELVKTICDFQESRRLVIPLPDYVSQVLATFAELSPIKFLTKDNLQSLSVDNVSKFKITDFFDIELHQLKDMMQPNNVLEKKQSRWAKKRTIANR